METTSFPSKGLSAAEEARPGFLRRWREWSFRRAVRRTLRILRDSVPPETQAFHETRFVEQEVANRAPSRTVPTPVNALTHLLNQHDQSRAGLAELSCVETTLRLAKDSNTLAYLRLPILEAAVRQLNNLTDVRKNAELAVLDLQLRRRIAELHARRQANGSFDKPEVKRPNVEHQTTLAARLYDTLFKDGDKKDWDRTRTDFQETQTLAEQERY